MLRLIFSLAAATAVAFACTPGNGAAIEVTGVVSQKTFPGAPNYESIADGDQAETFWFVTTGQELCFAPDGTLMDTETVLSEIQLLHTESFGLVEGGTYRISGKTFPATSGHHHTKVMIVIGSAKKI